MASRAILSVTYFGPVQWYQKLNRYGHVMIERYDSFIKQTYRNRCVIATANGLQALTVPVERMEQHDGKPLQKCMVKDVRISNHGNWRHLHWGALFSSYGKSPFFDYVADDLERVIRGNQRYLIDLNAELQQVVIDFLDLPISWSVADVQPSDEIMDLRGKVGENKPLSIDMHDVPYYQLWASRTGFLPDLSIMDMLCNLGRESVFALIEMSRR